MSVTPTTLSVKFKVHFATVRRGRKQLRSGDAPAALPTVGRVPRVARVMALAIKFEGLIGRGEVEDYADLARLGHVTRARVTQIMSLTALAPDIQEELLFLEFVQSGRDPIVENEIRPIAANANWSVQREKWRELLSLKA